jgi:hypothetical protein
VQLGDPGNAPEPNEPVEEPAPIATATALPTVSPTTTATAIPTATPTSTSTPTTTPVPDIINADFEQGPVGWEVIPDDGRTLITTDLPDGITAHSGEWVARIDGQALELQAITQEVKVPFDRPFLSFWYRVISEETRCDLGDAEDTVFFFVQEADDKYRSIELQPVCDRSATADWLQWVVDLRHYAGQEVGILVIVDSNETLPSILLVDNMTFQADGHYGFRNGGFEAGVNWWFEETGSGAPIIRTDLPAGIQPHSGSWAAWLNSADGEEIRSGFVQTALAQYITIPSEQSALSFWYRIDSEETNCFIDIAQVSLAPLDADNRVIIAERLHLNTFQLCRDTESEWQQYQIAIPSEYLGKRVSLAVTITEIMNDQHSSFFVDDIAFQPIPADARNLPRSVPTGNDGAVSPVVQNNPIWFPIDMPYLDRIAQMFWADSVSRRLP